MKWIVCGLVLLEMNVAAFAQGEGGGIFLCGGGRCEGVVAYDNFAVDGFGIAGDEGAVVVNATVVSNKRVEKKKKLLVPGMIFCNDGHVVDTASYKGKAVKDAIGIVFWVCGDYDATERIGAVVSFQEKTTYWSGPEEPKVNGDCQGTFYGYGRFYWRDTMCYQHTKLMVDTYDGYRFSNPRSRDELAGPYCSEYKPQNYPENQIRWCLPTIPFLSRLLNVRKIVEETMLFIRRMNPELTVSLLYTGKRPTVDNYRAGWYWACNDFTAGECGYAEAYNLFTATEAGGTRSPMFAKNEDQLLTRAIFVYDKDDVVTDDDE